MASNLDKDIKGAIKEIQKRVVKVLKNLKAPGLDYAISVSIDAMHPERVSYSVWIQPPANKLQRPEWLATDYDDLIAQLDKYIEKKVSDKEVQIVYHGAQIEACEASIKFHEDEIKKIKETMDGEK